MNQWFKADFYCALEVSGNLEASFTFVDADLHNGIIINSDPAGVFPDSLDETVNVNVSLDLHVNIAVVEISDPTGAA